MRGLNNCMLPQVSHSDSVAPQRLARAFAAAWKGPADRLPTAEPLGAALQATIDRARTEWPELSIERTDFAAYAAARLGEVPDLLRALDTLCAGDLYVACACARGLPKALDSFERYFLPAVREATSRMEGAAALTDEVEQRVRQRLLLAEGDRPPRIAEFRGTGPLRAWIRAAGLRIALDVVREQGRAEPLEEQDLSALEEATGDPELEFIKSRYRTDFRQAFAAALHSLAPRDRTVLRLHLVDGLNIDRIGALYQTHRSTAARWIAEARAALLDETRRSLSVRLQIDHSELDSLMTLVRSQLDISLTRYLEREDE
jgi:RNA polymerase sigma-70 factor (ECF subfamily)